MSSVYNPSILTGIRKLFGPKLSKSKPVEAEELVAVERKIDTAFTEIENKIDRFARVLNSHGTTVRDVEKAIARISRLGLSMTDVNALPSISPAPAKRFCDADLKLDE